MRKLIFLIITTLLTLSILTATPKEEFRAAWLTTVYRGDWPSNNTVSSQKSDMIQILDRLEELNFNAVMFQVRPACDAFYQSTIEPWSNWLTGTEGQAPSPFYDPLQFLIDEARKRNLEVHAWFNPFRAKAGNSSTSPTHVYNTHPEWVLAVGSSSAPAFSKEIAPEGKFMLLSQARGTISYILDPGKAAVRSYVLSVISDVATRYDIDGVHLDDYFYPYAGMNNEDAATFASENRGFVNINDWRRDNINLMIENIYNGLQVINPRIKFGVSPFGIWKSGVPSGIVGTSSYDQIYCDAVKWLDEQWVDYIAPQLYWPFGGGQDYGLLMPWWAGKANINSRHLYVGHAAYKIQDWPNDEIPNQINLNRSTAASLGSIYFSYRHIDENPKGVADQLKNTYYAKFALTPKMSWKENNPAPEPINVEININEGLATLTWEAGTMTAQHDDNAWSYIVYKWLENAAFDKDNSDYIEAIIPSSQPFSYSTSDYENYDFAVASLDRLKNESEKTTPGASSTSSVLTLDFEDDSDVVNWSPYDEVTSENWGTVCTWKSTGGVANSGALNFTDPGWTFYIKRALTAETGSSYSLTFDVKTSAWAHSTNTLNAKLIGLSTVEPEAVISNYSNYTQVTLSGVADAGTSGYLRFNGLNIADPTSMWLDNLVFNVDAATPITLSSFTAEAKNATVELKWETASETNNARFIIYRNDIRIGEVQGAGTSSETNTYSFIDAQLIPGQTYTYVLADVDYANKETRYSSQAITIQIDSDLPEMDFVVGSAYPNPFNPQTVIPVELSKNANIHATLHDIDGKKVKNIFKGYSESGRRELIIKAQDLSSGIYIANILINEQRFTQKLILLK